MARLAPTRTSARRAIEGDGDDVKITLGDLAFRPVSVIFYFAGIYGNCVTRTPMNPVSRITPGMPVKGTGGK